MSVKTDERVAECLNMASDAARRAEAAVSLSEAQFWLKMERRWHRIAQTYCQTDQLVAAWRLIDWELEFRRIGATISNLPGALPNEPSLRARYHRTDVLDELDAVVRAAQQLGERDLAQELGAAAIGRCPPPLLSSEPTRSELFAAAKPTC